MVYSHSDFHMVWMRNSNESKIWGGHRNHKTHLSGSESEPGFGAAGTGAMSTAQGGCRRLSLPVSGETNKHGRDAKGVTRQTVAPVVLFSNLTRPRWISIPSLETSDSKKMPSIPAQLSFARVDHLQHVPPSFRQWSMVVASRQIPTGMFPVETAPACRSVGVTVSITHTPGSR